MSLLEKLCEDGVGVLVKHTSTITVDEEAQLWSQGVMGVHTSKVLINAVFCLNGKTLCLRGGRDHKALKLSQFTGNDEGGEYICTLTTDLRKKMEYTRISLIKTR